MTQTYDVYWDGPGPALQRDDVSLEELEELGENWKIRGGKHRGMVAEELAAHADELIPEEERNHAVELEAAKGEEPSGLAKRIEDRGRDSLTVSPDSPRVKRWFSESEVESLRKAQEQEREEELAPENWRDEARREFEELQRAKRMDDEDRIEALSRKLEHRSNDFSSSNTWKDTPLADDIDIEVAHVETIEADKLEEAETPEVEAPEGTPDELSDYFEFGDRSIVVKSAHPDTIAELQALEAEGDATITERSDDGTVTAEIPEGREAIEARL